MSRASSSPSLLAAWETLAAGLARSAESVSAPVPLDVDPRVVYWFAFAARTVRVLTGDRVGFDVSERHGTYVVAFARAVEGAVAWRGTRRARRADVSWTSPGFAAWLRTQQPRYPAPATPPRPSRQRPADATQPCGLDVPVSWWAPWAAEPTLARAWIHGLWDASGSVVPSTERIPAQALLYGPAVLLRAVRVYWSTIAPAGLWVPPRPHPTTRAERGATLTIDGAARLAWFRAWLYAEATPAWGGLMPLRAALCALALTREEVRGVPGRGVSPYRGLAWDAERGMWRVRLVHQGVVHDAGLIANEHAAARAYDALCVRVGLPPANAAALPARRGRPPKERPA